MADSDETAREARPLPSMVELAKATLIALGVANAVMLFAILPAEFNIDPTGVGEALGLTRLAPAETPTATTDGQSAEDAPSPKHSVVVKVAAKQGAEYKLVMKKGDKLVYAWKTGAAMHYDFHGEPAGGPKGSFESFVVSAAAESKGTFTAPFDGVHGWYWKNTSTRPAEVTLQLSGAYTEPGLR